MRWNTARFLMAVVGPMDEGQGAKFAPCGLPTLCAVLTPLVPGQPLHFAIAGDGQHQYHSLLASGG